MKINDKTKKALTGLEWAILQSPDRFIDPDEFTTEDFSNATGSTNNSARSKLSRMVELKKLSVRKVNQSGKLVNAYKKA